MCICYYVEVGICDVYYEVVCGFKICFNYFDLFMIMDYWGEEWLNYYIEVVSMFYCVCECVCLYLEEG